jgi:hypothetical protein
MTRAALEQLRRQAAHTVELIDAILLAQPNAATQATRQLVPALRLLSSRVQLVLDAAQREGTPWNAAASAATCGTSFMMFVA